ncbi:MAG: hypothetical protein CML13_05325 [Puniceicoccaceae bacterium]|nr:hypothetical protein [Puniceicoccaceae bacterium]|tara:strand:+ start:390 stop:1268 length:879 start_codon:yes stop_codon:yes gene_type:complete
MNSKNYRYLPLLLASCTLLPTLKADVLGYWSFEDGELLTDNTGAADLTEDADGGSVSAYELPASGAGSAFPTTIPLTGATNSQAISFTSDIRLRPGNVRDSNFNTGRTATFETFLNASSVPGDGQVGLFGLWGSSSQYRQMKVSIIDGFLSAGANYGNTGASGSSQLVGSSTLSVAANVDYYAAAVFTGNATGDVVFYLQDLTNSGSLQSQTISLDATGDALGDFNNATNNYRYAMGTPLSTDYFNGIMDEVRVANHALSQSELLVSVPEPANMALLFGSVASLMLARRRRR